MEMFLSDSDCESFSESSSSEDLDDIDSMYGGQAQNILSNLDRSIGKIDDFLAFERGFVHGDIVSLELDPSGQLGKVVDVHMVVDLETVYGELIKDVNCKNLRRIRSLVSGDYVVLGTWLGRVNKVVDCVTILFDDGAKCEVTAVNPENLIPVSPSIIEDAQYPYYPGQRVRIRRLSAFKSARWLCGSWKENRDEGTVCQVEAGLVYVDWVASAMVDSGSSLDVPSSSQDSRELTLLSCFQYASWQLGDWCMVDDEKVVTDDSTSFSDTMHIEEQKKFGRLQLKNNRSKFEGIYVILRTKSKVDVLWQDGTHSIGIDSQSLTPANNVGDHEFWPEQFVLEKTASDDPHISSGPRFGTVKRMDAKERTVKVKWETRGPNTKIDLDERNNEETVSAYELIEYPDYTYCLGEVVFRFPSTHFIQADGSQERNSCTSTEAGEGLPCQSGDDLHPVSKVSGACHEHPNDGYLSCIGNVIGFKDGHILVKWAGGLTSKVKPSEIFGIDKIEDTLATSVRHEDTEDNSTSEEITNDSDEADNKNMRELNSLSLHQAAIGFFKNVAVNLFGFLGSTSVSSSMNTSHCGGLGKTYNLHSYGLPSENADGLMHGNGVMIENCELVNDDPVSDADDLHNHGNVNVDGEVQGSQDNKDHSFICEEPGPFKQFDMVGDCFDHHFVSGSGEGPLLSQVKRGWLKKVQQEWSILEKNLPETIYVRVCEERIDLLRAAIIGAPGTPYHDGLFFFDFYIPPNYPNEPPLVHYHSGGLRLNPNLYESGRVCLSLLKTWTGTGTEVWNPESSTILQVLLSLQALVLNEKPYFNEAGYDTLIGGAEGEKNSITYNENAFILSCKSMLYHLHKPLKNFETLVDEHFRNCAHSILLACKAYMDGAPVGCAFASGIRNPDDQKSSSMGFKIMVGKLIPKLVSEFTDKGINCSEFLESKD